MALETLNVYLRRLFSLGAINGETFDYSSLDGQNADFAEAINRLNARMNNISTADGSIKSRVSSTSFTATSAQTAFTVPTYNTTTDEVAAYTNSGSGNLTRIPVASITKTSVTVVTLPAQTLNATVIIDIFSPGSGTTTLAGTSAGQGASLVGIADAGGYTAQTTTEGALQELYSRTQGAAGKSFLEGVLVLSGYVLKSGGTMNNNASLTFAGTGTVAGLPASSANGQAVRHEQFTSLQTSITGITATFMPKSGGTFTGAVNFNSQVVNGVATPTTSDGAASKGYVDTTLASFGGLPVGTLADYAAATTPTGWLQCNGAAVSRATYASLFAVIGTTWGVGDGVTTFNVPDFRGRTTIGSGTGTGLTARALAATGGAETHALVTAELAAHTHTGWDGEQGTSSPPPSLPSSSFAAGNRGPSSATTGTTGVGTAHNNMQPFAVCTKIIKH